jgi:transcriptional regulator with XRE-family HTH domain
MLEGNIKNRIKELLEENNIKKTRLSVEMGYSPTFLNSIIGNKKSIFNIEHIEKICGAINYPVSQLFADVEQKPKSLTPGNIDAQTYQMFAEMEKESGGFLMGLRELYGNVTKLAPKKQKMLMSLLVKTMDTFAGFAKEEAA